MLVRSLESCSECIAGDNSILRELFNPLKEQLALRYSLAHASLPAGKATTPHSLKSSEVYYILSGTGIMHIDNAHKTVSEGDSVYIPPDSVQYILNPGPDMLVFLCIVDPAWRPESETIMHT
jgi:mannose-6-phosphate isomerase-like protein (cupin superfamily)